MGQGHCDRDGIFALHFGHVLSRNQCQTGQNKSQFAFCLCVNAFHCDRCQTGQGQSLQGQGHSKIKVVSRSSVNSKYVTSIYNQCSPVHLFALFQVYRHGDRSPTKTFPNDIYQEDAWPQGWGQLTQVRLLCY